MDNECLCETCDLWFAYEDENALNVSTDPLFPKYRWYCDDCLVEAKLELSKND